MGELGPADVFVAVFGAGVLLVSLVILLGTAALYIWHWIKGDGSDW